MRIFLHPEQLLAMLEEELGQLEMEGEHLVFRTPQDMDNKLSHVMQCAIIDSDPEVIQ